MSRFARRNRYARGEPSLVAEHELASRRPPPPSRLTACYGTRNRKLTLHVAEAGPAIRSRAPQTCARGDRLAASEHELASRRRCPRRALTAGNGPGIAKLALHVTKDRSERSRSARRRVCQRVARRRHFGSWVQISSKDDCALSDDLLNCSERPTGHATFDASLAPVAHSYTDLRRSTPLNGCGSVPASRSSCVFLETARTCMRARLRPLHPPIPQSATRTDMDYSENWNLRVVS